MLSGTPSSVATSAQTRVHSARVPALLPSRSLHKPSTCEPGSDTPAPPVNPSSRRQLLLSLSSLAAASVLVPRHAKAEPSVPFLLNSGAKGPLAEEEEKLFRLRQEKEGQVRQLLLEEKEKFETESRQTMAGKLCATPFGVDIVGITEFVALVGALVGGVTARNRKEELERLNEQLRKINLSLRQQARAGTVYAPGLSYAPAMEGSNGTSMPATTLPPPPRVKPASHGAKPAAAVATVTAPAAAPAASVQGASVTILSMEEEEMTSDQIQCRDALRQGKRLLKEKNGAGAMVRFEKALMLSKALGDKVQERRAMRGLAASARLQGQYRSAIKHLERVLEISKEMREFTGDADAYGTIADCYTDMGEFEKAAKYYDKYIDTMNRDGPV